MEKQGNTCKRNIPARMMEEDLVERGGGKGKFLGPWETRFPRPFERIVHGTRLPRYRRLKISPTAIFNVPLNRPLIERKVGRNELVEDGSTMLLVSSINISKKEELGKSNF